MIAGAVKERGVFLSTTNHLSSPSPDPPLESSYKSTGLFCFVFHPISLLCSVSLSSGFRNPVLSLMTQAKDMSNTVSLTNCSRVDKDRHRFSVRICEKRGEVRKTEDWRAGGVTHLSYSWMTQEQPSKVQALGEKLGRSLR